MSHGLRSLAARQAAPGKSSVPDSNPSLQAGGPPPEVSAAGPTQGQRPGAQNAAGQTRSCSVIYHGVLVDLTLYIVVSLAFAVLVTAHVSLLVGLLLRHPRWRAPLALLLPPLAPYWGYDSGMRVRTLLWVGAVCVYTVARILAGLGR